MRSLFNKFVALVGLVFLVAACGPAQQVPEKVIWVQVNPNYQSSLDVPDRAVRYLAQPRIVFPATLPDTPNERNAYVQKPIANVPAGQLGITDRGLIIQQGDHPELAQDEVVSYIWDGNIVWSTVAAELLADPQKCTRTVCEKTFSGPSLDDISTSIDLDVTIKFIVTPDTVNFFRKYPTLDSLKEMLKIEVGIPARYKALPGQFKFNDMYKNLNFTQDQMAEIVRHRVADNFVAHGIPAEVVSTLVREVTPADPNILAAINQLGLKNSQATTSEEVLLKKAELARQVLEKFKDEPWQVKVQVLMVVFDMDKVAASAFATEVLSTDPATVTPAP